MPVGSGSGFQNYDLLDPEPEPDPAENGPDPQPWLVNRHPFQDSDPVGSGSGKVHTYKVSEQLIARENLAHEYHVIAAWFLFRVIALHRYLLGSRKNVHRLTPTVELYGR